MGISNLCRDVPVRHVLGHAAYALATVLVAYRTSMQLYVLHQNGSFEVFLFSDGDSDCVFHISDLYMLHYSHRIAGIAWSWSICVLEGVSVKVLFV